MQPAVRQKSRDHRTRKNASAAEQFKAARRATNAAKGKQIWMEWAGQSKKAGIGRGGCMNQTSQDVAAEMLGAGQGQGERLQYSLYNAIARVDRLAQTIDAVIRNRQVIASIIVAWELANPKMRGLAE